MNRNRLSETPKFAVWGGINGVLFHQMLHGVDIQPPSSRFSKSIGHQHVLEPELRTTAGARNFAQHLLTKAAERLWRGDYYCSRIGRASFLCRRSRRLVG